jgi:hypothetical protein
VLILALVDTCPAQRNVENCVKLKPESLYYTQLMAECMWPSVADVLSVSRCSEKRMLLVVWGKTGYESRILHE